MKITESKLRQMIRGVIREFTSAASAAGASKRGGYESAATKSKEGKYVTAKSAVRTAEPTYKSKKHKTPQPARYVRKGRYSNRIFI